MISLPSYCIMLIAAMLASAAARFPLWVGLLSSVQQNLSIAIQSSFAASCCYVIICKHMYYHVAPGHIHATVVLMYK